ncbi:hypothetical protein R1flu_016941 [Riccia fluitans]|uniref:Uncharacterized protein n=1 Tax=Riccia fluitans TaxID=41844 RepID=A0ABD1YND3_9MARC
MCLPCIPFFDRPNYYYYEPALPPPPPPRPFYDDVVLGIPQVQFFSQHHHPHHHHPPPPMFYPPGRDRMEASSRSPFLAADGRSIMVVTADELDISSSVYVILGGRKCIELRSLKRGERKLLLA